LSVDGIQITDCVYDKIEICGDQYSVRKNKKWGLINVDGYRFVECIYDRIISFRNWFLIKSNGKWGIINTDGSVIVESIYDYYHMVSDKKGGQFCFIAVGINGKWGLINSNGELVVTTIYSKIGGYCSEKMLQVKIGDFWGFLNIETLSLINPIYELTSAYHDGVSKVKKDGKYGLTSRDGSIVLDCIFDSILDCHYWDPPVDLFLVKVGQFWGCMDSDGRTVMEPQFDSFEEDPKKGFHDNGLIMVQKDGLWGFIDETGNIVIEPIYEAFFASFNSSKEIIPAKKDGKYGYISKTGEVVIDFQYDIAKGFVLDFDIARVIINGKWAWIDVDGNIVLGPQDDEIPIPGLYYEQGLAVVHRNNLYGYMDTKGRMAIDHKFHAAESFSEGLAAVLVGTKWGYVDTTGNICIEPAYDSAGSFTGGVAKVERNGKWGFVGKLVCPSCETDLRDDFDICPLCGMDVLWFVGKCPKCHGKIEAGWIYCPFCKSALP